MLTQMISIIFRRMETDQVCNLNLDANTFFLVIDKDKDRIKCFYLDWKVSDRI